MAAPDHEKPAARLIDAAASGEERAAAELLPLVYHELRELAGSYLRKSPPGHTLQPTALVHEAYLRLVGQAPPGFAGRAHFFFAAARAMRDILVEHARQKLSLKKGGGRQRIDLTQVTVATEIPPAEMVALSEVLDRLERTDPRKHRMVMLRYFAGLTTDETAALLGVTARTVERDWRYARAWLHRELSADPSRGPP